MKYVGWLSKFDFKFKLCRYTKVYSNRCACYTKLQAFNEASKAGAYTRPLFSST